MADWRKIHTIRLTEAEVKVLDAGAAALQTSRSDLMRQASLEAARRALRAARRAQREREEAADEPG